MRAALQDRAVVGGQSAVALDTSNALTLEVGPRVWRAARTPLGRHQGGGRLETGHSMRRVNWQTPGGPLTSDPFVATEAAVHAMVASPWWMGAPPPQRVEAVTSRMLAGAGEWWLFGAWGRWYRCGLDGTWHLCPPPYQPGARQAVMPAPPGAGRPPVPPSIMPSGPDLTPGPLASTGLFGDPPAPPLTARLQQTLAAATSVNPAQFPMSDPQFTPGTPSTAAACLFAVLWCAGAPVFAAGHPILALFSRFLTGGGEGTRWFLPPDLPLIVGAYTERLRANDPMGASHVVRTLWETAEALRGDPAFRPRADALSAITGSTLRMVQNDHGGVRFGDAAVVQEWIRRCPPPLQVSLLRETAPSDHFRLALYDLAAAVAPLSAAASGPAEARRVAIGLLAADLDGAPGAVAAVMPWLDPEASRTLQGLGRHDHPLRELWPVDGVLPESLAGADPQVLRTLVAATYATDLAWCRMARTVPPSPGFTVPAAIMATLAGASTQGGLSPWEIIEAARAHLAEQRKAEEAPAEPPPATTAEPLPPSTPAPPTAAAPPDPRPNTPVPPTSVPPRPNTPVPSPFGPGSAVPPTSVAPSDAAATSVAPPEPVRPTSIAPSTPGPTPNTVQAYGIAFLPGEDDIERLLTELRRRGKWARSLRGQDVASGSAPAVLLIGEASTGQRRLTRMIARALADAGVNSGDVRTVPADELADADPKELRERLAEHGGHTLLIEGLDALILDEERGAAYAAALYRTRVEGVSDTTLVATCTPGRLHALTEASPELVTDFRSVRLPDFTDPRTRRELAALLAIERHLSLTADAWEVAQRDLDTMRGRGRLTNARLVEAYLDRACSRHLSQAGETQVFRGGGTITLDPTAFQGVAEELEP